MSYLREYVEGKKDFNDMTFSQRVVVAMVIPFAALTAVLFIVAPPVLVCTTIVGLIAGVHGHAIGWWMFGLSPILLILGYSLFGAERQ